MAPTAIRNMEVPRVTYGWYLVRGLGKPRDR
jgi:hypothetical protein